MIEVLWNRHYVSGVTGSYHGDMAHAFAKMLRDPDCDSTARRKMQISIRSHCQLERDPIHKGRKWFCERWGTALERHQLDPEEINAM